VYDGLDQIICSAALVTPRAGVFIDDIKHLLVIATPVEIILLAINFTGGNINGEIGLIPSNNFIFLHSVCH
jgi:nuclear pore complex protein Nup155